MLKYEMIRVDDRLLHGQVLMKWIKHFEGEAGRCFK